LVWWRINIIEIYIGGRPMKYFHIKESKHWITNYGFEECDKTVIGLTCQYEKYLPSESGLYTVWVGVDFKRQLVHIYVEYGCGGEVAKETIDFSYVDTEEEYDFMTELDTIISKYMEI
jgi:hypothetical protein